MTERLYGATKVEIFLEPSGGDGLELGVRLPDGKLMWADADDGFIPREMELEIGNAQIFGDIDSALHRAIPYIQRKLKEAGWQ